VGPEQPDARAFELGPVGGQGPALLCLHGLTGTPYEVRPPEVLVARHGFACLGPELPGHHGDPAVLARTHRQEWVECALVAYDRLVATHRRVYVLGLSLGGVLALRVAQERSAAGILVLAAPIDLGLWYRLAIPWVARVRPMIGKTPAIADPVARDRHPGYRCMPLPAVVELMRLQVEVESRLDRVRSPLRLLYSRSDPTVSVRDAQRILDRATSADGRVEYLARSAHVITVDVERTQVEDWIVATLLELEQRYR